MAPRLALPGVLLAAAGVAGQEVAWTGSVEMATGDYFFTERATSFYLFQGASVRWGGVRFTGSLPLILQDNPVVATVGAMPLPTGGDRHGQLGGRGTGMGGGTDAGMGNGPGGPGGGSVRPSPLPRATLRVDEELGIDPAGSFELSVGDPLLGAGVDLDVEAGPLRTVSLGASVKPPLNDADSGVGTGAWDAGAGLGAVLRAGRLLLLLDAAWWSYGDLPELELRDALSYGAALGGPLGSGRLGWTLSLLGTTEIIDGVEPPVSAGAGLLYTDGRGRGLRVGASVGLTEAASDFSASLGWTLPIAGRP